jgi:type IV secretory pathway VirB10-like protein
MSDSRYDLGGGGPDGLELRPRPRTTRLNRNALLAGALLLGGVAIAAAVTLVESKKPIEAADATAVAIDRNADAFWRSQPDGVRFPPELSAGPEATAIARASDAASATVVPVASAGPNDAERMRLERKRRALDAVPVVAGFRGPAVAASLDGPPNGVTPASRAQDHPPMLGALAEALAPRDPTILQNNQGGKKSFLDSASVGESEETNPHLVRKAISPYEVTAGMILPAILVTQGDSDLPGLMTARVRENVYDSATGGHLLVPQGTTLVGVYDSVVTFGQRRLLIAWQRLIFPDGTKLNIGGMPGTDLIGAAGFHDQVDRHYTRIFGSALLLSVITAGATLSQDDNKTGGKQRSTRDQVKDTLATALGRNLGEVTSEMIRREMNIQATIQIRPGYRFNVLVKRDLIFEGPYLNTFAGGLIP